MYHANLQFGIFTHQQCNLFFQESIPHLEEYDKNAKEENPKVRSILKKRSDSLQPVKMMDQQQMDLVSQSPGTDNNHLHVGWRSAEPRAASCDGVDRAMSISGSAAPNMHRRASDKPDLTKFARMRHFVKGKVLSQCIYVYVC